MRVFAVDTALEACSAALVDEGRVLAVRSEPMVRGHQERLALLVAELFSEAATPMSSVELIAVTAGPGSFTGLRVGLAFAKGLGLALSRPVIGIGALEALAAPAAEGLTAAAIDAKRGQVYLQAFRDGRPASDPAVLDLENAIETLIKLDAKGPSTLAGPGASLLTQAFPDVAVHPARFADPVVVARLAAARDPVSAPPRPLYLRAPDARLPA